MLKKQPETRRSVLLISALATLHFTVSTDSSAMNQEGHDGSWIDDFPPAIALMKAIPEARPLPSRNCPVTREMLASNPYEQIQLPRHRCPKEQSPARSQVYPTSTR